MISLENKPINRRVGLFHFFFSFGVFVSFCCWDGGRDRRIQNYGPWGGKKYKLRNHTVIYFMKRKYNSSLYTENETFETLNKVNLLNTRHQSRNTKCNTWYPIHCKHYLFILSASAVHFLTKMFQYSKTIQNAFCKIFLEQIKHSKCASKALRRPLKL